MFSSLDFSYCAIINSLTNLMHNLSALCIIQDNLLREIGDKNPHAEFLQLLFMKCSFNLFGSEHVRCILSHLSDDRYGNRHLEDSSVQLLLVREITLKERILKLVDISSFFLLSSFVLLTPNIP